MQESKTERANNSKTDGSDQECPNTEPVASIIGYNENSQTLSSSDSESDFGRPSVNLSCKFGQKMSSPLLSRRNKKRKYEKEPAALPRVLKQISTLKEGILNKDENDAFGQYIAQSLKKLNPVEQIILRGKLLAVMDKFTIEKLAHED